MKYLKQIALLAVGLALIANVVMLYPVVNFTLGLVLTGCFGILFLVYGVFFRKIQRAGGVIKWLRWLFWAGMLCMAALILFLAAYGSYDTADCREDAVIVLGAAIRGEDPSLPLADRLKKAVEYHRENPDALIVVSGGQGFQESISEAEAMERYLVKKGVPRELILKEEQAASTYENFLYSKQLLDRTFSGKNYRIAYITNDFHCYRAGQVARLAGFSDSTRLHTSTSWYTLTIHYFRECAAVAKVWVMGK
ncbi:MAG: YdcF family protein [Clostridia bacterium]|nr:YdcF family protein [Clostridia bacterium]